MSYTVYSQQMYSRKVSRLLLTLCFVSFALLGWAQDKEFVKKNFKDDKKGYRKAMDSIKKGDSYYLLGAHFYHFAIPYYMSAEKFNPNSATINYKIGKCMIYSSMKTHAATYLEIAISLNADVAPDAHYCLARAYHLTMNWDKAKLQYSTYLQTLTPEQTRQITDVRKKIDECNNGKLLSQSPTRAFIDNVGTTINTQYPEYSPEISSDGSKMIYTARIPNGSKKSIDEKDGQSFENIFISYYKNGKWSPAENLGTPVNKGKSNNAAAGISPDGQTLYIYHSSRNGDIYQTHLDNNEWTKPQKMAKPINSDGKETSITFSRDGKTMYFVSDRLGGYGMGDIYKSTADGEGNWSDPQNLGAAINTQYDEKGVFLQPDGNTLYFSSTGHNTMGGYDVFKTVYDSGHWSSPENLGYPVNTPGDDIFFVMPSDGKHAYYSSDLRSGSGDMDIYMITFLGAEKPMMVSTTPNTLSGITSHIADVMSTEAVAVPLANRAILSGIVVDSETHTPLFASIELVDNKKNTSVSHFNTDSLTGKYVVTLVSGVNYGITVKADKHLFYSANLDLTDSTHYHEIVKNIAMQPLEVGSHVALRNIFFDYDKSSLRKESAGELVRIIDLLHKYPTLKIEIDGYTDDKGAVDYNMALSTSRAQSVINYLKTHGIAPGRLTAKGFGAANPVASNATDAGRQLNRRTEFKITGK